MSVTRITNYQHSFAISFRQSRVVRDTVVFTFCSFHCHSKLHSCSRILLTLLFLTYIRGSPRNSTNNIPCHFLLKTINCIFVKVIHYTVILVTVSLIYVQIIRFSLSADNRSVQQQALGIPDISWSL